MNDSLGGRIKDAHAESRMFAARVYISIAVAIVLLGILITRLVHLQVMNHQAYRDLSVGNSLRLEPIAPTRGLIYDRDGRILAENVPTWQLELTPERVSNIDATLAALADEAFIDASRVDALRDSIRRSPSHSAVVLKTRLDEASVARFATRRPYFPGIDVSARLIRHYPFGPLGVHAIGYVGGISTNDIEALDQSENYVATRHFGKTGIERQYESLLHGVIGHQQRLTNARGRSLQVVPGAAATPGAAIQLTLDVELQRAAEQALDGRRGAVVALDPRNGELLAMASLPTFNPNGFATGMGQAEYGALRDDLNRPLFNRAVRGQYPPGSTIKPLLAIAALETHTASLEHRLHCKGAYSLPGSSHRYRDWKPEGHGIVNLHDAIAQSCDVYFYEFATRLGIDSMGAYLAEFGMGSPTGVDIPGEKSGLVPSRDWKRQQFTRREDKSWFPGETVIASIGQGYMLATPLQLAQITAVLAMRGDRFEPRLMKAVINAEGERLASEPVALPPVILDEDQHWEAVANAMFDVLNDPSGSAFAVGVDAPFPMAGKSGTAQVFSVAQEDEYNEDELDERLRDHALFVAFAPTDEPRIAVAVIVENGSSGSRTAAPIAREVIDAWLNETPVENSESMLSRGH